MSKETFRDMSPQESRRKRLVTGLLALGAAAATTVAMAAPAVAASGSGEATIVVGQGKGRTLSGQSVKLIAGAGAGSAGRKLTLPIGELNPGAQPSATSSASLAFKRGKKKVALTGIRFDLGAGTLAGKLGGKEIAVFQLGAAPSVDSVAGSIALSGGKLRLTAEAATALKQKLGLEQPLVRKGVGSVWLAAQAAPTHAARRPIVSGSLEWGFLTSWREYVYKELGPGSIGSITTEGGATTSGNPAQPGSFFAFPASGGSFVKGLYGAGDQLALNTQGSVKFAKPGHCIIEIKFSNVVVNLGAGGSIVADLSYDIDKFNGMGCTDQPPVSAPGTTIATLGSVAAVTSAGGNTVTWTGVPATLTGAAATPFAPQYKAGQELDPATISVGLG
ncbi:MAG TPA: HtaA domain-containing protein [Solirubrobacterales bacterium]|nr:HtaA domain-containing protein [Solirubrobacterales bacterium]